MCTKISRLRHVVGKGPFKEAKQRYLFWEMNTNTPLREFHRNGCSHWNGWIVLKDTALEYHVIRLLSLIERMCIILKTRKYLRNSQIFVILIISFNGNVFTMWTEIQFLWVKRNNLFSRIQQTHCFRQMHRIWIVLVNWTKCTILEYFTE